MIHSSKYSKSTNSFSLVIFCTGMFKLDRVKVFFVVNVPGNEVAKLNSNTVEYGT